MDSSTLPATLALLVGLLVLLACSAVMSQLLPDSARAWWRRWSARSQRPTDPDLESESPPRRRGLTGVLAADRVRPVAAPARQPALRPDVLRRERERLSAAESRRVIEEMADDDPARLAALVGELLAADREDTEGTR